MNVKLKRPVRVLCAFLAATTLFSTGVFGAELNEKDSRTGMLVEREVPVEVGQLVTGTAMGMGTVQALGVNVRENPNMDAAVVTVLDQGDQVVVLSKDGDWYRISCEGVAGFVSCDYMTLEQTGEGDLGYAKVRSEGANVRASADAESEAVTAVGADSVVTITGISDGWYEVDVDGVTGYIRSDLVDPTAKIYAQEIYDYVVVLCNGANLRSQPSEDADKVDMLYGNSRCTLLSEEGDFYQVQYGDTVGYVHTSLVSVTNDNTWGSTELQTYNQEVAAQKAAEEAAKKAAAAAAVKKQNTSSSSGSSSSSSSSSSSISSSSSNTSYSYTAPSYDSSSSSSIVDVAYNYLGVPYVWGGTSPSGFDCSGFTQYVMRQCGYSINRVADAQYYNGSYVSYNDLQAGDLVFFSNTYAASGITHVGIYVGGGSFIHAANGGVKVSSLSSSYYASRYYGARRIA